MIGDSSAINDVAASSEIYLFRVVLRDPSPHVWRHIRFVAALLSANFIILLQVAFGWAGSRPDRFLNSRESPRNAFSRASGRC